MNSLGDFCADLAVPNLFFLLLFFFIFFQFDDGIRVSGIIIFYLETGAVRGEVLEVAFRLG